MNTLLRVLPWHVNDVWPSFLISDWSWSFPQSPSTVHEEDEDTEMPAEVFENSGQSNEPDTSLEQVGTGGIPNNTRVSSPP